MSRFLPVLLTVGLVVAVAMGLQRSWSNVEFNRDVRPILNDNCLQCHGGVRKKAGLSFLFEDEAFAPLESEETAIVRGDARASEMIRRITHHDPEERMPAEEDPLTKAEVDVLRRWINQGAKWEKHWAYFQPVAVEPPSGGTWGRNGIDGFTLRAMKKAGLSPSDDAPCHKLVRRVSFDLVGLPPDPARVEALCENDDDGAYDVYVDELLAQPSFGEHWSVMWMDLARYSDSRGYEKDGARNIWRYRDWVIRALNDDMPFSRFTVEQLAGDLLPDATEDQLIATAFHRNTMTNDEGGTDDEEFRVAAVVDRVNTTFETWQGTTMSCVQCHTHPYDPFTHHEFYQVYAFFNNTADADRTDEAPTLSMYGPSEREKALGLVRELIAGQVDERRPLSDLVDTAGFPNGRIEAEDADSAEKVFIGGQSVIGSIQNGAWAAFGEVDLSGASFLSLGYSSGGTGGSLEVRAGSRSGRVLATFDLPETGGWGSSRVVWQPIDAPREPVSLFLVCKGPDGGSLYNLDWFAPHEPEDFNGLDPADWFARADALRSIKFDRTPIMRELQGEDRRVTQLLDRGSFLTPTDTVDVGVPDILNPWSPDWSRDRLGFARWLLSLENPLTARVTVNRFWHNIFGRGIVETVDDFGSRGSEPTHPELLDWLAVRFQTELAWSIKSLLREIVTSSTYRQSSDVSEERLRLDPGNSLLARGRRARLSGEQIRDQALAVSGLLSSTMYGPSVFPPQPEGIWNAPYSGEKWVPSEGEDRYRRSVYTYHRRTAPYPAFITFDGSSREMCTSRRIPTNTPLQALVTLNDEVHIEAASALGKNMLAGGEGLEEQIHSGFRRVLYRDATTEELAVMTKLFRDALTYYEDAGEQTFSRFVAVSEHEPDPAMADQSEPDLPVNGSEAELEAMSTVANALLNLDAVITSE